VGVCPGGGKRRHVDEAYEDELSLWSSTGLRRECPLPRWLTNNYGCRALKGGNGEV
jgi:hypothetical protein